MNALEQEVGVFTDAIDRIRTEIFNAVETLPLDEILKKLAAISADAVLNTSQTLVDLLIDVFTKLAKWSIDELFESRISIPIISDILRGFGIDASFSLFDLICLIAAVVATLTYKVARNRAPFSESDGFTSRILAANSMNDLRTSFADTNIGFMSNRAATSGPGKQRSWIIDKMKIELTPVQQEALFSTCRIFAGIVEFLSIPIIVLDCGQAYNKKISFLATVFGICSVGLNFLPNQFASPCPIDNKTWAGIDGGITTLKLVKKVGFWGWGKYKTKGMKGQKEVDIEAEHDVLGAGVDVPLALLSLAPTIRHFYELSKKPESKDRTLAIIDETSSICDCLSKIGIFAAKQVKDPKSKIIIAGVTGAVVGVTGCLHLSEGIVNLAA
jgi:hypothetical protein